MLHHRTRALIDQIYPESLDAAHASPTKLWHICGSLKLHLETSLKRWGYPKSKEATPQEREEMLHLWRQFLIARYPDESEYLQNCEQGLLYVRAMAEHAVFTAVAYGSVIHRDHAYDSCSALVTVCRDFDMPATTEALPSQPTAQVIKLSRFLIERPRPASR
jgi:hypothetical protein